MANIKILFWLHKSKINEQGLAPIKLRLTFNKVRKDVSTGFFIKPDSWNNKKGLVKGNKNSEKQINEFLAFAKGRIMSIYNDQIATGGIDLDKLLSSVFQQEVNKQYSLLDAVIDHNEFLKQRVEIDYSFSTWEKYLITQKKLTEFLRHHYKKKDINVIDIPSNFLQEFDYYLKIVDKNKHNTATKYCKNLKRIMNFAVSMGKTPSNPFKSYSATYKLTNITYLTFQEVELLEQKSTGIKRIELVKDAFLFQCYTGLAYSDLKSLRRKEITIGNDGNRWIIKRRVKTEVFYTLPLLPQALGLLEKYSPYEGESVMPLYCIQKYNQYLQEMAGFYGIQKQVTSHVGRRTFGNLALASGISLNVIAKMMGHSNTLITQKIYAISTEIIVSSEMKKMLSGADKESPENHYG
jgi:integrase